MDLASTLAQTPLLENLDEDGIEALAAAGVQRVVRSGELLYREGDDPDAVHFVASGRLRVTSADAVVGYVGRLEPVGEIGALMGDPRAASVQAVRDTTVISIATDDFVQTLEQRPGSLLALTRMAIARMRAAGSNRMTTATEQQGTIAVVPGSPDVPVQALAEALVRRLGGWPTTRLIGTAHVDAALGEGAAAAQLEDDERFAAWIGDLEPRHRWIVFVAEDREDEWALRCLHNADRVLVVAEALAPPRPIPALAQMRRGGAPVEIVLLRPEGGASPHTLGWRELTGARAHYFLHPDDPVATAALARQLTGRGVGLVLGGGGARGFAHIGLVRACEELGIPIDVTGGTSMGAFMAALVAMGLDSVEMAATARETFVRNNFLNDYRVPRVSLIAGRRFTARLQAIFGDTQMEDLRRTCFCVSTSLTTGAVVVADRGPLYVWVGASMAVPGVAPPVAYDGQLLCDGGVVDNLPTQVMQSLERGAIVACNVSGADALGAPGLGLEGPDPEAFLRRDVARPWLGEILVRSATLGSATAAAEAAKRADVYLRMPVEGIGMFDWRALDRLVDSAHAYALEQLGPLRDQLVR